MAIRVFTDSGADLTPELARELNIHVVPLTIHFGDHVYQDGVDIAPAEFYRKLTSSADLPNTSQPSPGEFLAAYREHSEPGDTIISLHLSSKLSGTYQSAVLASKQLSDRTVHVIDTLSASMGIALPAIYAARWIAEGLSIEDILLRCKDMIASTRIYCLVDTLEYLQRHGRIGRAQALVGSLLNIKPVLCVDAGEVAAADRVRGQSQAQARLLELSLKGTQPGKKYVCAVMDADNSEASAELTDAIHKRLPEAEVFIAPLGPTIGTHTGPGTIGVIISTLP